MLVTRTTRKRKLSEASVTITSHLCKGCGYCVSCCPQEALKISSDINERGYNYAVYAGEGCTGCGFCFYNCPEPGAVTVYRKLKRSSQVGGMASDIAEHAGG